MGIDNLLQDTTEQENTGYIITLLLNDWNWYCQKLFLRMRNAYQPGTNMFSHLLWCKIYWQSMYRADSRFAPSQWETALLCNDVSHWLVSNLESALMYSCFRFISYITHIMYICIRPNLKQGEQTRPHELFETLLKLESVTARISD